jgi:FkbM family methyltransferase
MLAERFESVVACEPAVESYAQLEEYVPANVKPLNIAVSETTGPLTLRTTTLTAKWGELFTGDSLPWGEHMGYRTVGAWTLDDLAEAYGYPDFIKVDTEGHEVEVLAGGPNVWLRKPRFVIEIHSAVNGATIRAWLESIDLEYEVQNHDSYRLESPHRVNHYWLTSPGKML